MWGCRGDSEHPLLVFFGTVNGTFLLHKRKVGLRERPSHRDAVKTPNNRAEAVTVFCVACGAVLSTDGKYPKVAGTIAMRPRPSTLFRYSGGCGPLGARPNPRGRETRKPNMIPVGGGVPDDPLIR